jgi:sec-independent protein translocase protein TatA
MGLENPLHIALLLMVLLLVFGAKRLPEMGRGLGDGLRSFKDAVSGQDAHHELTQHPTPAETTSATPAATVVHEPAPAQTTAPEPVPAESASTPPAPREVPL